METRRIEWIDIAKGFSILLVIIGHGIGGMLRGIIFSFHMPLFFILSSATFKLSSNGDEFLKKSEKSFKHLLVPAFGIYIAYTVISLVKDFSLLTDYSIYELRLYFSNIINVFVFGSGTKVSVGEAVVDRIGIPWFFFVLFFGRTLFDYLHLRLKEKAFYIAIVICSVAGVCVGMVQKLPFSFDIALAIQPFLLFGLRLRNNNTEEKALKTLLISFAVWIILFFITYKISGSYLELALRRYTLYPICFICAASGTVFVSSFSQIFSKVKALSAPIKYLGKNSIVLLCVHCFDNYFSFAWDLTEIRYVNVIIRVAEDVLIFLLIMLIIETVGKRKHKKQ